MTLAQNGGSVDVSVLVPARDEAENLPEFLAQCAVALAPGKVTYEVLVVNDGSADRTEAVLAELRAEYAFLRSEHHRVGRGIASALRTGAEHARGRVLVFYPADLQFKPEDIPRLAEPVVAGEADIITGFKEGKYEKAPAVRRQCPRGVRFPSGVSSSRTGGSGSSSSIQATSSSHE